MFLCKHFLTLMPFDPGVSQRPRYVELRAVMTQIPKINVGALDQYDRALSDPNSLKTGDKRRKDKFKKLIAGTLGVMLCSATREQCFIWEMPAALWESAAVPIAPSGAGWRGYACRVGESVLQLNMAVAC